MAPSRRRQLSLLRLLLPLMAAGCAAPGEQAGEAFREAIASGQASLAAVGAPVPRPGPVLGGSVAAPGEDHDASIGRRSAGDAGVLRGSRPRPFAEAPPRLRLAAIGPAPTSAAELLGLPPDALRHRLGEPSLRRTEGPAEIWLYSAEACALDLILYGERGGRGGGMPRVAHAAARAAGTELRTEAACLAEIAGGAASPPAGGALRRSAPAPAGATASG